MKKMFHLFELNIHFQPCLAQAGRGNELQEITVEKKKWFFLGKVLCKPKTSAIDGVNNKRISETEKNSQAF